MPRVRHIENSQEFGAALQGAAGKLVVVDYSATWCGPCQRIGPVFDRLSDKYPAVEFLKVDVDQCRDVAAAMGVRSMPTFQFFKDGGKVEEFSGASEQQLEDTIVRLSMPAAEGAAASAEAASDCGVPGYRRLNDFVNTAEMECLNQSTEHTIKHLFGDGAGAEGAFLESDCDEQLIVRLVFRQNVKVHSLRLKAPADGRGPLTIKVYSNRPNAPDFDEAEKLAEVQTLTLKPDDLEGKLVPLKFVKYQNVSSLTLFVQDNQGGEDTSVISSLELIGQLRDTTNMSEFKRVAGKAGERDH